MNDATSDTLDVFDMTPETLISRTAPETPTKATEERTTKGEQAAEQTAADAQPEGTTEPPKPADAAEIKRLQDSLEKLESRLVEKDRYIGKRGDEVGKLKKDLTKLRESLGLGEDADPEEALKERQAQEIEAHREGVKGWLEKNNPDFAKKFTDYAEIMKEDGADEETIRKYSDDPLSMNFTAIHFLTKRHEERANHKDQLAERDKQIEDLKAKLTGIPSKLAAAAKAAPPKSSPVSERVNHDDVDVYEMTPADIKARARRAKA